jgi:steroid delta-isomerase-like uncharacterized protein
MLSIQILTRLILLYFLLTIGLVFANHPESRETSVGEHLIRSFADFWSSKDIDQLDLIYAEDAIFEDVAEGASYKGLAEIKQSLHDDITYAPDVQVKIISILVVGNRGVLEWFWSGTQTGDIPGLMPATGKKFSIRGVSIFEFEGDRIKKQSDYYDAARFLHQLGVKFEFPATEK